MKNEFPKNGRKKKQPYNKYIKYTNIALQMAVIIGAGAWGGTALDKKYRPGEFPLFTLLLTLISVALAMALVIRSVINEEE